MLKRQKARFSRAFWGPGCRWLRSIFYCQTDRADRCCFVGMTGRACWSSDWTGRVCCLAAVDSADFAVPWCCSSLSAGASSCACNGADRSFDWRKNGRVAHSISHNRGEQKCSISHTTESKKLTNQPAPKLMRKKIQRRSIHPSQSGISVKLIGDGAGKRRLF